MSSSRRRHATAVRVKKSRQNQVVIEPTHRIGRNRPDQKQKERDFGSVGASSSAAFDDEIAFAPEWRG
jgi:hypothetical protein